MPLRIGAGALSGAATLRNETGMYLVFSDIAEASICSIPDLPRKVIKLNGSGTKPTGGGTEFAGAHPFTPSSVMLSFDSLTRGHVREIH